MNGPPFPICIIDDGMDLCRELRGWFEQAGHAVACPSPNRLTLAHLAGEPPALMVVGINNGNSASLSFYQRLVSHRRLRQVPIIAVSNDPDLEYELLDAYDFHAPPLDRKRLLATVGRLIEAAGKGQPPLLAHLSTEQLAPYCQLLHERSGLHFSTGNRRLLERGVLHRMQALQMAVPEKYLAYLARTGDNHDELNKLLGLLTIGETCFFRYQAHRDVLIREVLPELLAHRAATRQLRIWSAGCSTGEEPYSLAMVLLEHFPQLHDWNVQILATDINKRALRQAREGVYRARALRQTDETFRKRYFHQAGEQFVLDKQVRNMVRFSYLNLLADPFPQADSGTADLDLILCRNVLIYFQPETIRQVIDRFSHSLRPGGYLFLGHAETLQGIASLFQRLHQHGAFFYQRKHEEQSRPAPRSMPVPAAPPAPVPSPPPAPVVMSGIVSPATAAPLSPSLKKAPPVRLTDEHLFAQAMAAFDREEFTVADRLFDLLLKDHPDHPRALVGKGLLSANRGDYQDARQWCARAIRHDDLCPAAYLLRGLILDLEEQLERALVEYQKVLWLDRDYVMAHYLSAKVYGRLGRTEPQVRALHNAIRTLEKQSYNGIIPFSGGVSRPVLLEICRKELATLQRTG
jgi:chemotaxis protein methyltransferase CheR